MILAFVISAFAVGCLVGLVIANRTHSKALDSLTQRMQALRTRKL